MLALASQSGSVLFVRNLGQRRTSEERTSVGSYAIPALVWHPVTQ